MKTKTILMIGAVILSVLVAYAVGSVKSYVRIEVGNPTHTVLEIPKAYIFWPIFNDKDGVNLKANVHDFQRLDHSIPLTPKEQIDGTLSISVGDNNRMLPYEEGMNEVFKTYHSPVKGPIVYGLQSMRPKSGERANMGEWYYVLKDGKPKEYLTCTVGGPHDLCKGGFVLGKIYAHYRFSKNQLSSWQKIRQGTEVLLNSFMTK